MPERIVRPPERPGLATPADLRVERDDLRLEPDEVRVEPDDARSETKPAHMAPPPAPGAPPAPAALTELAVLTDPAAALAALDPVRARLLAALREPVSAAALAGVVDMPRQLVNYHLRALEQHDLVRRVHERRRGNATERTVRASARAYLVAPQAAAGLAPDPGAPGPRWSATRLVALAGRLVGEVGSLLQRAESAGRPVVAFGLDVEVRFSSASARAAFADDLAAAVAELVSRYDAPDAVTGREHRVVVGLHPTPPRATAPIEPPPAAAPAAGPPAR